MSHYQALKDNFLPFEIFESFIPALLLTQFCRDLYVTVERIPKLYHADNNMDPGLVPLKLMICVVK